MKKIPALFILFFLQFSCENDIKLSFSESNSVFNENAIIEINIPVANGNHKASDSINAKIESHIANALNFAEEDLPSLQLHDAISNFDNEYLRFRTDFQEDFVVWEATFDAEVIYQSDNLICIAITTYMNTGGAHGNMNITLYNFEVETGRSLQNSDLISDETTFTRIVKTHFEKEFVNDNNDTDYFFGEEFHLPANIGFNDEGVLILYNTYEIASYATGVTEFTIPFDEVEAYLISY